MFCFQGCTRSSAGCRKALKLDCRFAAEALPNLTDDRTDHTFTSTGDRCSATVTTKSVSTNSLAMVNRHKQTGRRIRSDFVALSVENKLLKNQLKVVQAENDCLKSKSTAHSAHTHNHVQQEFVASKHFGIAEVKDHDSKFKFYTGLTFYQFIVLCKFLEPAASKLTGWNRYVKYPETSFK